VAWAAASDEQLRAWCHSARCVRPTRTE
jgi:hypothetical protein